MITVKECLFSVLAFFDSLHKRWRHRWYGPRYRPGWTDMHDRRHWHRRNGPL